MAQLQLGTAQVNITPPLGVSLAGSFNDRKATDIHDDLHVKTMVIGNGETKLAIAICDIILIERQDTDIAKERIAEECGIPPDHVMICATHTHSAAAPADILSVQREGEYMLRVRRKIADSVRLAVDRMEPTLWGRGVGHEDRVVSCRRFRMKTGGVRMNPGLNDPNRLEPEGPIDPDVNVLCFKRSDKSTAGLLCNYALHYVSSRGKGTEISANYFAAFCEIIQRLLGERFQAILANGCCGDINNSYATTIPHKTGPYEQLRHVATVLAAEVLKTVEFMEFTPEAELGASMEKLVIKRRTPGGEELARIKRDLDSYGGNEERYQQYAGEHDLLKQAPTEDKTYVSAMRIGDLALVGLPGEIFVEIGLEIKKRSPFKHTFCVELANDWIGYIPTKRAFEGGGYETWLARSSRAVPEAGEMMVESAVRQLEKLHGAR
ncbi:MAG: hypothetical protein GXP25_05510 [Planctomycetes bacterium]|nr:hypothetical protein [Planctomycetota bacterium]